MDAMTSDKTTTRRRYRVDFKAQVLCECNAPGASVAKVATSHGINTNVVHGWRKLSREAGRRIVGRRATLAEPPGLRGVCCPRAYLATCLGQDRHPFPYPHVRPRR